MNISKEAKMKIKSSNQKDECYFENSKPGDVFRYAEIIFIRVGEGSHARYSAISASNGNFVNFEPDWLVVPLDAELIIKE